MEVGWLAHEMHLLKDDPSWTPTVNAAFTANETMVTALAHGTTPASLHWLKEFANPVEHAAPELWTRILLSWDRKSVANLLVGFPEEARAALNALDARKIASQLAVWQRGFQ